MYAYKVKIKNICIALISAMLFLLAIAGVFWFIFLNPALGVQLGAFGWYALSFASGLSTIVLPCMLPLAFVIVPLAIRGGYRKGLGMALSFGLGISITLSLYGAFAAFVGAESLKYFAIDRSDITNWVYVFAGIFAYVFALGELGLIRFRVPGYVGGAPQLISRRKNYFKAFLIGLFLGNIGVGCPHPGVPLLLTEAASSGDVFYGWSLFFVHAIGRLIPLILLAILGLLGFNGLDWVIKRKKHIEHTNGWTMAITSAFVITLGLFTQSWWVNYSGQYQLIERIGQGVYSTQISEVVVTGAFAEQLRPSVGLFGQPQSFGNAFLVLLWLVPLWWSYIRERKRVLTQPMIRVLQIEHEMDRLEHERRGLEVVLNIPHGTQMHRYKELEVMIDTLEKERRSFEEAARYGSSGHHLRSMGEKMLEIKALSFRRNWYIALSLIVVYVFCSYLPGLAKEERNMRQYPYENTQLTTTYRYHVGSIDDLENVFLETTKNLK